MESTKGWSREGQELCAEIRGAEGFGGSGTFSSPSRVTKSRGYGGKASPPGMTAGRYWHCAPAGGRARRRLALRPAWLSENQEIQTSELTKRRVRRDHRVATRQGEGGEVGVHPQLGRGRAAHCELLP